MSNPNIKEAGKATRWTERPKGAGRKPAMLKEFLKKESKVSMDDIVHIFQKILTSYSVEEIKKIAQFGNDPKTGEKVAAIVSGFCLAFLADSKRGWGGNGFMQHMLDRAFGKTPQEVINHDGEDLAKNLSQADRKAYLDSLIKKRMEEQHAREPEKKDT